MILTINHSDKLELSSKCYAIRKDPRNLSTEYLHIFSKFVRPSIPNSTILQLQTAPWQIRFLTGL